MEKWSLKKTEAWKTNKHAIIDRNFVPGAAAWRIPPNITLSDVWLVHHMVNSMKHAPHSPSCEEHDVFCRTESTYHIALLSEEDETWLQLTCIENFTKFGPVVFEICQRTDRQRHGSSQYFTPLPGVKQQLNHLGEHEYCGWHWNCGRSDNCNIPDGFFCWIFRFPCNW